MSNRLGLAALTAALLAVAPSYAAGPKTYQVTGPILAIDANTIKTYSYYDADGRVTEIVDGNANRAYSYFDKNGQVIAGAVPMVKPELSGEFATLMQWADGVRRMKVRATHAVCCTGRSAAPVTLTEPDVPCPAAGRPSPRTGPTTGRC